MMYLLPNDVLCNEFMLYYESLMIQKMVHDLLPRILNVYGGLFYE